MTDAARLLAGCQPHARDHVPTSAELREVRPARGSLSHTLRIGGLAIEPFGLDDRLSRLIHDSYQGFTVGDTGVPTFAMRSRPIGIDVVEAPVPHYLYLPRGEGKAEEARIGFRGTPEGLELWSYFFAGWFDRDATRGRLLLCEAADGDLRQAVENYLRFFVSTLALRTGGFLLHSSGVIRDGQAWLFFGPSGAGKTTAATHSWPTAELLGDDLVLVEPWRTGFRACGVPFRGTFEGPANSSSAAPIAMACRIFQAPEVRLEEVSRVVQAAEVLGELPFLLSDPELQARASERAHEFVRAVPVRRLYLRPDSSFWDVLIPR
jgi:hypothetical protein